jgi:predicted transcriptional regulator
MMHLLSHNGLLKMKPQIKRLKMMMDGIKSQEDVENVLLLNLVEVSEIEVQHMATKVALVEVEAGAAVTTIEETAVVNTEEIGAQIGPVTTVTIEAEAIIVGTEITRPTKIVEEVVASIMNEAKATITMTEAKAKIEDNTENRGTNNIKIMAGVMEEDIEIIVLILTMKDKLIIMVVGINRTSMTNQLIIIEIGRLTSVARIDL